MSQRYKGAVISATPPTVSATSPNAYGTAKGVWTLQQQMQYEGAGTWPNPFAPVYIEDVFSTYLYTGNGSTQTIINNIDLSTKGGLIWMKDRSIAYDHALFDTQRGRAYGLSSNLSSSQTFSSAGQDLSSFNSNGFTVGAPTYYNSTNRNGDSIVSWTFRKQPKFFDVVTYTGDGTSNRAINHSLGAVPGCVIVKKTNAAQNWAVWHRTFTTGDHIYLNTTGAVVNNTVVFGTNANTSTTFNVGSFLNANGDTYVAYLFAHNAGGFGDAGSDNVISCGSFVGSSSSAVTVTLGYEPQYILMKDTTGAGPWWLWDTMRGLVVDNASGTGDKYLFADASSAEAGTYGIDPTSTGFIASAGWSNGATYIYIAIRRGPMKTPTSGTSVFAPIANSNSTGATNTTNFPVDMQMWALRGGYGENFTVHDRLRGVSTTSTQTSCPDIITSSTAAEKSTSFVVRNWNNTGFETPSGLSGASVIYQNFSRAPGFFDVVCYTGTGSTPGSFNHNLGVVPEMVIVKSRSLSTENWRVWAVTYSGGALSLNSNAAKTIGGFGGAGTIPATSSVFYVSASSTPNNMNSSGATYVAYLFATVANVSKVGSYTGTGALQIINCGFTTGARFILIKRTDSTGDWWVYDSARGISSSNDPYLWLNSTNAEVTNTNYVDTTSVGFQLTASAPDGLNANGGTYIFLAIA